MSARDRYVDVECCLFTFVYKGDIWSVEMGSFVG